MVSLGIIKKRAHIRQRRLRHEDPVLTSIDGVDHAQASAVGAHQNLVVEHIHFTVCIRIGAAIGDDGRT